MNYELVRNAIDAYIKANGKGEITGEILNEILAKIVEEMGDGCRFYGSVSTTYQPTEEERSKNLFYLATEPGVYNEFDGVNVYNYEIAFIYRHENTYHKASFIIGTPITIDTTNHILHYNKNGVEYLYSLTPYNQTPPDPQTTVTYRNPVIASFEYNDGENVSESGGQFYPLLTFSVIKETVTSKSSTTETVNYSYENGVWTSSTPPRDKITIRFSGSNVNPNTGMLTIGQNADNEQKSFNAKVTITTTDNNQNDSMDANVIQDAHYNEWEIERQYYENMRISDFYYNKVSASGGTLTPVARIKIDYVTKYVNGELEKEEKTIDLLHGTVPDNISFSFTLLSYGINLNTQTGEATIPPSEELSEHTVGTVRLYVEREIAEDEYETKQQSAHITQLAYEPATYIYMGGCSRSDIANFSVTNIQSGEQVELTEPTTGLFSNYNTQVRWIATPPNVQITGWVEQLFNSSMEYVTMNQTFEIDGIRYTVYYYSSLVNQNNSHLITIEKTRIQ